jgi:hypothetical protein
VTRDGGGIKISTPRGGKKAALWRAGHALRRALKAEQGTRQQRIPPFRAPICSSWPIGNTGRLSSTAWLFTLRCPVEHRSGEYAEA